MSKSARSFLLGDLAIAVVVVVGIPALLLYNGFGICAKQPDAGFPHYKIGFLSDEEAFDAAIDQAINMSSHVTETPTGGYSLFAPKKQIKYSSREEFRRLNRDCCKVVPHDRSSIILSWWHEVFGRAAKSVNVIYTVRYFDEDGKQSRETAVLQAVISNCGEVLN